MIFPVFEKKQALYIYTLEELLEMSAEGRLNLRETNKVYVRHIRSYIIENSKVNNVYLPPLVAAVSDGNLVEGKPTSLQIVDGSHRLKALLTLPDIVEKMIYSRERQTSEQGFALHYAYPHFSIAIQVYEGLANEEMSQLYLDLNTKGKKVALSKRIAYDSRDKINLITNRLLQNNKNLQIAGVEVEKASVIRPNNRNFLSLAQLRNIVGIFSTGKDMESKLKKGQPVDLEEAYNLVEIWLDELFKMYPPHRIGDYHYSMLASYPMQLALVHYALEGLKDEPYQHKEQIMRQRMQRLSHVDWKRDQEVWEQFDGIRQGKWKYFYLNKDKKNIKTIVKWLNKKGGEVDVKNS